MPRSTVLDLSQEEHAQLLAALRRARYGYLLALHILLLCAATRNPTEIAAVLFCSRSSVYRTVRAYRAGTLGLESDAQGRLAPPVRTTVLTPSLQRSLLALLKAAPHTYGWCRTRWSCATLALTLQTKRGITVSAETMRPGSTSSVGCGSGPSWGPKTMISIASLAWPGFGGCSSSSSSARAWSLRMNWISISCPKSAVPGCPKGPRWKS